MFQQQKTFTKGASAEVDSVAIHALTLLALHAGGKSNGRDTDSVKCDASFVHDLTQRLYDAAISTDGGDVAAEIKEMQLAGPSNRGIASGPVPAVARQLGAAWEDDSASFAVVTIGCARLQSILRQLEATDCQDHIFSHGTTRNCLVVVAEGAQHTLGAIALA